MKQTGAKVGDSIFLACARQFELEKITSLARDKIAKDLELIDDNVFAFVGLWIIQCLKKMKLQIKLNSAIILFQCPKAV